MPFPSAPDTTEDVCSTLAQLWLGDFSPSSRDHLGREGVDFWACEKGTCTAGDQDLEQRTILRTYCIPDTVQTSLHFILTGACKALPIMSILEADEMGVHGGEDTPQLHLNPELSGSHLLLLL